MSAFQPSNPDQENRPSEPPTIDHEALLCKIQRQLRATAPTAENGPFFMVCLQLLRRLPAKDERDDIQAAIKLVRHRFHQAEKAGIISLTSTLESNAIAAIAKLEHQLGCIESELLRPDLTKTEQALLKKKHLLGRRELIAMSDIAEHLIDKQLEGTNVPAKEKTI